MSSAAQALNILLVEDDEDDYLFTQEYLEGIPGQNYNITWVPNYVDGLKTIASQPFDVTLVDYRIDTGTGLEFIRMIRARNIDCPAILLTGVRSREVDVAAQQAGASDYLVKGSLSSEILERSIRYAIAHAERRRILDSVLANIDAAVIALDAHDGVMMMNATARAIVGLDEIGQYAPDNSIGIFSNVRRFLGEPPYPAKVFCAKGREYVLRMVPLANDGKLIIMREPGTVRSPVAMDGNGASESWQLGSPPARGLAPAASGAMFSWMEKVLAASKHLTKAQGATSWQQFAAELRHSGRRLVHQVNELQKVSAIDPEAAAEAQVDRASPPATATPNRNPSRETVDA